MCKDCEHCNDWEICCEEKCSEDLPRRFHFDLNAINQFGQQIRVERDYDWYEEVESELQPWLDTFECLLRAAGFCLGGHLTLEDN